MNYDDAIYQIIEVARADKTLTAKWRNKAISDLENAIAKFHMAKTTTDRKPPESQTAHFKALGQASGNATGILSSEGSETIVGPAAQATGPQNGACTCPLGGRRHDCPKHGEEI